MKTFTITVTDTKTNLNAEGISLTDAVGILLKTLIITSVEEVLNQASEKEKRTDSTYKKDNE